MDSLYDFKVTLSPDTCIRAYVAKIVGEDQKYKYKRKFVHLHSRKTAEGYQYEPDLDDYGVYELSIKYYENIPDGRYLGRYQRWYLVFDGMDVPLAKEAVLHTCRWLNMYLSTKGDVVA